MKLAAIAFLLFFSAGAEKARFDFYRVYEISIDEKVHLDLMREIQEYPDGYKFLNSPPNVIGVKALLLVPPHKFGEWSELTEKYSLSANLKINNFQEHLDKHDRRRRSKRSVLDWSRFWTLDEIYGWIQQKIDERPNDLSWFKIGESYEGREIKGLKINVLNSPGKPSIFYEATIHANEWLGATSVTYIINELLDDPSMASLLLRFEWYFLPVLNVDGFTYGWEVDRTWRKTRKPTRSLLCHGTDPNRNSDVNWNVSGTSSNPCSMYYPGDFAFSEPEVYQLTEFLKKVPNLDFYFTFHTFGQFTMIPTGYSLERIPSYQLHYDIGEISNQAIFNKTGARYNLGTTTDFFGLLSGVSSDWVHDNLRPKLTYCWEIRPTLGEEWRWVGQGYEGFESLVYSSTLIEPTGQDMYAGTITVIEEAVRRGIA